MLQKQRIKNILDYHVQKNPGVRLVKVTTTRWYEIPAGSSGRPDDLLQEWFCTCSATKRHAFRDDSLLLEYFNDDQKITDTDEVCSSKVIIDEEDFSKLIHRIETMIQAPENKAAQQFARTAVETLKGYMPSVVAKEKQGDLIC